MILFIAFHGRGYLCNPKYIHKYMIESNVYDEYKYIWAVKDNKSAEIENAYVIKYNSIKYLYYLAKSKYWVVNCKLPNYVVKKKNQVYLQTWHGTPLKKLAHDINIGENASFYRTKLTRDEMLKTYDNDSQKYDYFVSPNRFATEKFLSSFKLDKNKIIETGYPRNDFLINISSDKVNLLKDKYKIPRNKKIILYAPTWRDNSFTSKGYTHELKVDFNLWNKELGEDYIVIFKPHYLIINRYENLEEFLYTFNEQIDINELYVMSDILVTDYSSVFFDYAILNKPIIFYMYDLKDYEENLRGFYLDIYKDLPGEIFEDELQVINTIKNISEYAENKRDVLAEFNKRYNYLQDGHSSRRIIKKIISEN